MKTPSAKKPSKKKSTTNGGQQKEKATKEDKAKGKVLKKQQEEEAQVEGVQVQGKPGVATQNSSQSATDSRSLALQRLSAVSNFLASRHHDANSEPIFLESSESAGEPDTSMGAVISLTLDTRTNESKRVEAASPTTTITTTTTTNPTTKTTTTNTSLSGSSTHLPRESSTSSDCRSKSKQLTSETQQQEQHSLLEEPSWWQDTSLQINTASALDRGEMPYRLRHIDSGDEQAWWLRGAGEEDEDDTLAEESHNPLDDEQDVSAATTQQGWWSSEEKQQQSAQNGHASEEVQQEEKEEQSQIRTMPRSRISPEHAAWWLDEEQQQQQESQSSKQNGYHKQQQQEEQEEEVAHVEVTIKLPSHSGSSSRSKLGPSQSSDSNGHWWLSGPAKKLFNVQRVESGERAWWQEKENEPPPAVQAQAPPTPPPRIIKHWESGERAWWLQEEQPEVEEKVEQPAPGQDELDNQLSSSFNFSYSVRPPPLGQCASPVPPEQAQLAEAEQLLAEEQRKLCASPYDNIPMSKVQKSLSPPAAQSQSASPPAAARYSCHYTPPPPARVGEKLFISRHQNIDELLGGACRPLSPLFMQAAAATLESSAAEPPASKNMFLLEEITPDQVRIHDSTAQLPVIQRMQR